MLRSLPGEAGGATTPIREEAKTVIVFDNGAVLRSGANLTAGRTLILSNASGRDVVCRIGAGKNLPSIKGYVEVEFIEPVNDFWGVHQDQPPTAPAAQAPSTSVDASPAGTLPRPASIIEMPVKPSSPSPAGNRPFEAPPSSAAIPPASVREQKSQPPSPSFDPAEKSPYGYSHAELAVPDPIANWTPPDAEKPAPKLTPSDLSGTGTAGAPVAPAPGRDFMNHGLMAYEQSGSSTQNDSSGRTPLIVGVAALVLAVACGVFFLVHRNTAPAPIAKAPVEAQPAAPAASSAANPPAAPAPQDQTAPSAASTDAQPQPQDQPLQVDALPPTEAPSPTPAVAKSPAATDSRPDSRTPRPAGKQPAAKQAAATPSRPAALANLKMTSPTAPNTASNSLSDVGSPVAELAPSEPPGATPPAGLLTSAGRTSKPPVAPLSPAPPAPAAAPAAPKVVRDPKLISSARAIYPEAARQTNIQGTVTVLANIDENGRVAGARAIGGPVMLRQAAVDSVKQWKYAPGTVDGKPSPGQVTVSVDFRLN